jgi:small neutral amino acid transporter SnatA (MarC family)
MSRQSRAPRPDAIEAWREAQDHRYDFDYYGRTGRVNLLLRSHVGVILVFLGLCFSLVGLLGILSGSVSLPLIAGGILLLAAGFGVLRSRSRRTYARDQHTRSAPRRPHRRKKAHQ